MSIQIGDRVTLRGHMIIMTVTDVGGSWALCSWFDVRLRLQDFTFNLDVLDLVKVGNQA